MISKRPFKDLTFAEQAFQIERIHRLEKCGIEFELDERGVCREKKDVSEKLRARSLLESMGMHNVIASV